ncbi:hypothetical protein BREVNS_1196 [Brevinematales bacterium NS]|nr:hypothetical protein BREVNS_1196 [Brevinematales bacterium NS]
MPVVVLVSHKETLAHSCKGLIEIFCLWDKPFFSFGDFSPCLLAIFKKRFTMIA